MGVGWLVVGSWGQVYFCVGVVVDVGVMVFGLIVQLNLGIMPGGIVEVVWVSLVEVLC